MIEDVEYLIQNSEVDNIPFFIDSSIRNKEFYNSASEYQIEFSQPFTYVTGFDILDATIPTTMYNVDINNNTLSFGQLEILDAVNYEPKTLFHELSDTKTFSTLFEMKDPEKHLFVIPEADAVINPELEVTNFPFTSLGENYYEAVRYSIDIPASLFIKVSVKDEPEKYAYMLYDGDIYAIERTIANYMYTLVIDEDNFHVNNITNLGVNNEINPVLSMFKVYYYKFYKSLVVTPPTGSVAHYYFYYMTVDGGNYDITSIKSALNSLMNPKFISVESTTTDNRQGLIRFNSSKMFIINAKTGTLSPNLGFEVRDANTVSVRENRDVFLSNESSGIWSITPPGLVNLLGERYVILRIKEIEDHLLGAYAHMNLTSGVAMFKLAAGISDVTNLRFDFVNLVRKPFHPIGKLTKLTLRFETASGELYDFKGVNHQIMFVVKILKPKQRNSFTKSILNPSYDPNIVQYIYSDKNAKYREDSDFEEEFLNNKFYNMYKKKMDNHYYDSTEEEDTTEDEDSDSDDA